MTLLLRLLLAGDIILSLIATPVFVGGLGLGSGAGGSSFFEKTSLESNADERKAAFIIFKQTCDPAKWSSSSPLYPQNPDGLVKLVNNPAIDWEKICQPLALNNQKKGIIFQDGQGAAMRLLFSNKLDRRVMYAIAYLYEKRFGATGYDVSCEEDGKAAPLMTLQLQLGSKYSSPEDDPQAGIIKDNALSPHWRGESFDISTFGCSKIYDDDGNLKEIIPNQTGDPSSSSTQPVKIVADQLASFVSSQDIDAATLQNIGTNAKSGLDLFTAGAGAISAASGAVAAAGELPDPNNAPTIFADIGKNVKDKGEDFAIADIAGKMLEQKIGLPAGTLSKGADLGQAGRALLQQKTGISLPDQLTAGNTPQVLNQILAQKNPSLALQIPQQAVDLLGQKNYDQALRVIAANDLSQKFSVNISSNDSTQTVAAKILSQQVSADPNEKQLLSALISGGTDGLSSALKNYEQLRLQTAAGQLASSLQEVPVLNDNQKSILSDFFSTDPVVRDGALRRFKDATSDTNETYTWMKKNVNLAGDDLTAAKKTFDFYDGSADPKAALAQANPTLNQKILAAAIDSLPPEEKETFNKVLDYKTTADDLQKALKDGRLEQAGKATVLSKTLGNIGLNKSDADQIASEMTSGGITTAAGLSAFNSQYSDKLGTKLSADDFKTSAGQSYPPAVQKIALAQIQEKTGLGADVVQAAFKGDSAQIKRVAIGQVTSKLGLPSWTQSAVQSFIANNDAGAVSQAGAKAQAKALATGLGKNPTERQQISDKLSQAYDDGLQKGKTAAQDEATNLLKSEGMGETDAKKVISGNFDGAGTEAAAAALSQSGYGSYDEIKGALNGDANSKYALSDRLAAGGLQKQNIATPTNFSKTLFEGTDAQKEAVLKSVGQQYAAGQVQQISQSLGVPLSRDQANNLIQNKDWSALKSAGTDMAKNEAASGLSQATGGLVSPDGIKSIYDKYNSRGLTSTDYKQLGSNIVERQTGIPISSLGDIKDNLKNIKGNFTSQFNPNVMMGNIGSAVILNNVVGSTLAQIDPTGGLATSFLMTKASTYLISLGLSAPVLLGISFILDPQATLQSIEQTVQMAFNILTNPLGFLGGLLGGVFGGGKIKVDVKNPSAKNKDDVKVDKNIKANVKDNSGQGSQNSGQSTPSTEDMAPPSTFNWLRLSAPLALADTIDSSQKSTANANQVSANTSQYLLPKEVSLESIRQISIRTVDQLGEDLLIFSLAKDYPQIWNNIMSATGIKAPDFSLKVNQIISPRVLAPNSARAKIKKSVKYLYDDKDEGDKNHKSVAETLDLARKVYGANFDPVTTYGRKPGFLYNEKTTDKIHVGL